MAAGYDGSIRIDTSIDTKGFDKGTQELNKDLGGVQSSLKGVASAIGIGFSVAAVKSFGNEIIETTAELQAMDAQFNQIFKGEEGEAALEAINKQADDLGIHADRLKDSFNSFGGQVKGAGMDAAQALEATSKATQLAADAAAFYDVNLESSSASLASFMKGNFEAGDAIGVFTNAKQMDVRSNEMYGKSWADLAESERQWLLLDTVSKTYEMNGAMGQAAREQGNWANVTENLSATWHSFLEIVGGPILSGAVAVIQGITGAVSALVDLVTEHKDLFTVIGIAIGTLTAAILAYNIAQNAAAIATALSTAATTAFGAVMAFITSPITLVVAAIGALIAIVYLLITHWDQVKEAAKYAWQIIQYAWTNAGEWFNKTVVEPINKFFTDLWNDIRYIAEFTWEAIKSVWSKASSWFNTKVIEPIKTYFRGAINFLIGLAEGFANGFIKGVNAIIRALNRISFDVPDWVPVIGGMQWGFELPTAKEISIPRLATGAVIPPRGEYLAMLGDQKYGRNIETPESLLRQIMKEELGSSGGSAAGSGNMTIIVKLGDETITERVINNINRQSRISGKTVITV